MRFRSNAGFESEFESDAHIREVMLEHAREVLAIAKEDAPEGPTGGYRDSLIFKAYARGSSIIGAVATTDFAGHIVEWGSIRTPAYAVIRRAAKRAGLRLDEDVR